MKKKIIHLLFVLCLIKLYHIADRSLKFSPNILINSFGKSVAEKSSLNFTADDVLPIRNFFVSKNILEFKFKDGIMKNPDMTYQSIIEFTYPIKMKQYATILLSHNMDDVQSNCVLLHSTKNFNVHDCK
tara:strand:- start:1757 stop:2143 length:387 start_codon:yes stop_codon:yes gene_type:complete